LFGDLLTPEGYRVSLNNFANTTSQLLDAVREMQPDLVILDFIIGGEGKGWQLLQAMKMDRATRDIPVIVCSAAVTVLNELGAHLLAMQVRTMLKPFDIDDLLRLVEEVWAGPVAEHSVDAGSMANLA
jgi:CheY-like chemotaxis protein